jgi:GR25 family glycosyltransferase involved in LPS biosynthesis
MLKTSSKKESCKWIRMELSPVQLTNVPIGDYIYALDQCLNKTTAPFIAIFEDDIVFVDGWLSKTVQGLAQLRTQSNSWLYLRLFYTETALKRRNDQDSWFRYLWLTVLLNVSAFAACLTLVRYLCKPARRILTFSTIAVFSLVTVPAFTGLYFMIGKYSVHALSGVTRMDKHGCCTQSLVFPRSQVPDLISYLARRKAGQTDTMIEEYADEYKLERYALSPQVVQHIGLVSSRDNLEINTKSTWAFWFEASDAAQLGAEHQELSKGTIWRTSGRDTAD